MAACLLTWHEFFAKYMQRKQTHACVYVLGHTFKPITCATVIVEKCSHNAKILHVLLSIIDEVCSYYYESQYTWNVGHLCLLIQLLCVCVGGWMQSVCLCSIHNSRFEIYLLKLHVLRHCTVYLLINTISWFYSFLYG